MKNKALIAVLLAMAALSAGCNTVAGAGKDIERGGENSGRGPEVAQGGVASRTVRNRLPR